MQTFQFRSERFLNRIRTLIINRIFWVVLPAVVTHAPKVGAKYVLCAVKTRLQPRFDGAKIDGIGNDSQVVGDNFCVYGFFKGPRMLALQQIVLFGAFMVLAGGDGAHLLYVGQRLLQLGAHVFSNIFNLASRAVHRPGYLHQPKSQTLPCQAGEHAPRSSIPPL